MKITVAVCTHERPELLERCLQTLLPQLTKQDELLVVDSAPVTEKTCLIVDGTPARYIYEARPGLDVARNAAIKAAYGDIVAFIDDDVVVGNGWMEALRGAFFDAPVACVTGRVLPLSIETDAQRHFEFRFSFDRGDHSRRFTGHDDRSWFPIHPYHLGTGCNMAFRHAVFEKIGLFDEALDAGTLAGGGGDLDMFRRLLLAGLEATYAPDVLAYHTHRTQARANRRQFWNYGKTFGALMAKVGWHEARLRWQVPRLIWQQFVMLLRLVLGRLRQLHELPLHLIALEGLGNLAGPMAYFLSIRQATAQRAIFVLPKGVENGSKAGLTETAVSLIICTRDRPQQLHRCLSSVSRLSGRLHELIVVDNGRTAPVDDCLIARLGGRLLCESLPGLCRARNRGLSVASGDIVAFIDDDVILDEQWLTALTAPYAETAVQAVTGLVLPLLQETEAQRIFEQNMGGLGRGRERKRFRGQRDKPLAPKAGVGANMSFRRQALLALGGFNEALDPGSPAQAGGDIDVFYRLLGAGGTIVYEPAVVVWHEHRRQMEQLKAMARAYGTGTAAAYTSWCLRGDWRAVRMWIALYVRYFPAQWRDAFIGHKAIPPGLVWEAFRGALVGPLRYGQARNRVRRYPSLLNGLDSAVWQPGVSRQKGVIIDC